MSDEGRTRDAGFTLIELLVTLVVIGIAIGFVLFSPNVIRQTPLVQETATDLANRLALARDEAALQGRNLGIRFYPDGYRFLDLDPDSGAWTTLQGDELLAGLEFDDDVIVRLSIEDRRIQLEPPADDDDEEEPELIDAFGNRIERAGEPPHVVILASGEVTPFVLELEQIGSDDYVRLESDFFGELEMTTERLR